MAARLDDASEGLSEARIALIRERIASGVYDDPGVAGQTAERLLASGDLAILA